MLNRASANIQTATTTCALIIQRGIAGIADQEGSETKMNFHYFTIHIIGRKPRTNVYEVTSEHGDVLGIACRMWLEAKK